MNYQKPVRKQALAGATPVRYMSQQAKAWIGSHFDCSVAP